MQPHAQLNPREELVALLRGQAACPILAGLGQRGFLDRMLGGPFSIEDFPEVTEPSLFDGTLNYLVSLGLLDRLKNPETSHYAVTSVGEDRVHPIRIVPADPLLPRLL